MSSAGGIVSPNLNGNSTDFSIQALSEIFGQNWWEVLSAAPQPGTNAYVIIEMLKQLNELSIFAVTFIFAITLASALVGTAHEGTPLGKSLHSFWVPMRFTLATGMLIPIKAGLCLFQIMILLTVGTSIQFANQLWEKFTGVVLEEPLQDFIDGPQKNEANPFRVIAGNHVNGILNNLIYITNEVEQGYMPASGLASRKGWQTTEVKKFFGGSYYKDFTYQFINPIASNEDDTGMGIIAITCVDDSYAAQNQCITTRNKYNELMKTIYPIAQETVGIARGLKDGSGGLPTDQLNEIILDLATFYDSQYRLSTEQGVQALTAESAEFRNNVKAVGWVGAGAYYHSISNFQGKLAQLANVNVTVTPTSLSFGTDIKGQRVQEATRITQDVSNEEAVNMIKRIDEEGMAVVFPDIGWSTQWAIKNMSEGDPVHALSLLGHKIIAGANTAVGTWAILKGLASAAHEDSSFFSQISGLFGKNFVTGFMIGSLEVFGGLFWLFFGALYAIGHVLAYYLPAIPFIIWTAAVISWIILVVEVIVAAPIWVVAHAMPQGEGFAGERGRQGYLLLLSILVRPFLMLIGLCIAIVITAGIGKLIGLLFSLYAGSANASLENYDGLSGLFLTAPNTAIAYILLLGAMMIVLTHKTFSLITYLPDKVMRWVGGHTENYGEASDEKEVHNMVGGFVTRVGGQVKGGTKEKGAQNYVNKANGEKKQEGAINTNDSTRKEWTSPTDKSENTVSSRASSYGGIKASDSDTITPNEKSDDFFSIDDIPDDVPIR